MATASPYSTRASEEGEEKEEGEGEEEGDEEEEDERKGDGSRERGRERFKAFTTRSNTIRLRFKPLCVNE